MRTVMIAVALFVVSAQALACGDRPDPVFVTIGGTRIDLVQAEKNAGQAVNGVTVVAVMVTTTRGAESRAVNITLRLGTGPNRTFRLAYPTLTRGGGCKQAIVRH